MGFALAGHTVLSVICPAETVGFARLEAMYCRTPLQPNNVNSDLLICADKYDVKRLVNVCVKHFESIIDTNNVMEIAFTAYLIEHEQLLKKASKFIINNAGQIKKPDNWDQITNTHPQITKKVMDLVIFKTQSLTI